MMCTRTIATGAGITGNADCPPAFLQSGNPVPLGLWCCAVSSPVAAPGLTRTYMLTAYTRRLHSMSHSSSYTHSLMWVHFEQIPAARPYLLYSRRPATLSGAIFPAFIEP